MLKLGLLTRMMTMVPMPNWAVLKQKKNMESLSKKNHFSVEQQILLAKHLTS